MKTNEEIINQIVKIMPLASASIHIRDAATRAAEAALSFKDEQPIAELGGWHTEPPTEDGCYLVETTYITYKNSDFLVAEYDTNAQAWYDEAYEKEIEIKRWKRI